jgi:hypothetical protein
MARIPVQTGPFLWGAAAGAAALAIVGFNWGGWVTGSTSEQRAVASADQAMIASLTPICVAQFRKDPKAKASLAAMSDIDSWQRGEYVSKGGWATMPGSTGEPSREVASACAAALTT